MGHREAARRALSTHDILTGLTTLSGLVTVGAGIIILLERHHHIGATLVEVFAGAFIATILLLRLRDATAARIKYHYDRVNIADLTAKWGGMHDRSRRERAARIIGRQ